MAVFKMKKVHRRWLMSSIFDMKPEITWKLFDGCLGTQLLKSGWFQLMLHKSYSDFRRGPYENLQYISMELGN